MCQKMSPGKQSNPISGTNPAGERAASLASSAVSEGHFAAEAAEAVTEHEEYRNRLSDIRATYHAELASLSRHFYSELN